MRRVRLVSFLAIALCGLFASACPSAFGAWSAPAMGTTTAQAGLIGAPSSITATPTAAFDCTNVALSWTAGSNASGYKIDYQHGSGLWVMLQSNWAASPYTDPSGNAGHLNTSVTYRITSLMSGSSWTTSATSSAVNCGIGAITDLAITNRCSSIVLTFTTPYNNTTTYKVEYSTNGGSTWASLGNLARTGSSGSISYFNNTAPVATYNTAYVWRLTPNSGTGSISNTSNSINWDNFRLQSITNANSGGTIGVLDGNDTTVAAFSKTVVEGGGVMVDNNLTVVGRTKMYLANTGSITNNGLGLFTNGANVFANTTVNAVGTGVWNAANTTYTWTENTTTSMTQSAALTAGSFTASTNTQCDPTPPNLTAGTIAKVALSAAPTGAPAVSFGGRW